jgi:nucleotide-binding universal stress UspA family protein
METQYRDRVPANQSPAVSRLSAPDEPAAPPGIAARHGVGEGASAWDPVALGGALLAAAYQNVLCATDLSPRSEEAVRVAYRLAAPGGVVHLLYVDERAPMVNPIDGTYIWWEGDAEEQARVEARTTALLGRLAPADARAAGIRTQAHVAHGGGVPARVLEEAKRVQADAIVVGTHGRTGVGRILMGSVAAEVLKQASIPVVLVRDPAPAGA